jgi:putative transcriptional regulator
VLNCLKEKRAAVGLSQAALAERLGVSRQSINAIETGRWDPSLPLAFELAEVFACRIEDLFQHRPAGGSDGR